MKRARTVTNDAVHISLGRNMKEAQLEPTFNPRNIPLDVLPLIFEYLVDRRDLRVCAQLSRTFHEAATPILYRTLDSRVKKTRHGREAVCHPASTLLKRPEYARYVRHVRETGAIGFSKPELLHDCQQAMKLCTNIQSFSWSDESPDASHNDGVLLTFLKILQNLNLRQLTIRTYLGLGEEVWKKLQEFRGLTKVSLWVMEGPPRVLQGWSEHLGPTLTHLELGVGVITSSISHHRSHSQLTMQRTAGVPASILISVFSHLKNLRALRLKGAPTSAIAEILHILPCLETLDTEFFGCAVMPHVEPVARLRELTVRTSSIDVQGPQQLWAWLHRLLPFPSLESFTLHAFSYQGEATLPRHFMLEMARQQKTTLKHVNVSTALLTPEDVKCLCTYFPALETLSCAIGSCNEAKQLESAVADGRNLRELRFHTTWVPSCSGIEQIKIPFELENARNLMLRDHSRIRVIGVGSALYTGQWVQSGSRGELVFEVVRDFVYDA